MQDIISHLTPEGTPERCGIITKAGVVIELDNAHSEPVRGFRITPEDILEHFDATEATWHTHPGADPNLSEEDYAGFMQWPDLTHYVAGIRDGEPLVLGFAVVDGILVSL